MDPFIRVKGAREHNLKGVDVDIPRDKLVVITGLSGSGKSSLAFDTIYAEGQRRYVESLSAYARQFLEMMQKPDVEHISGLSPAISIEQKTTSKNPRSTVGTVTEIYDYMRLLFARVGIPYSPATGLPIESQTVSMMVDRIMDMEEGTRLYLRAPIIRGRKGEYKKEFQQLQQKGFTRVKVDGEFYEIDEVPALDKKKKHTIDVVVDRIAVREDITIRLADSVETALNLSDGLLIAEFADDGEEVVFSSRFACPVSGFTLPEVEPRLFSFNNPYGACPDCDGLGKTLDMDPERVIPDVEKTLRGGAVEPWSSSTSTFYFQTLEALAEHYGCDVDTPWKDLSRDLREAILIGTGKTAIKIVFKEGRREYRTEKPFEGVLNNLQRRWKDTESSWMREELSKYQSTSQCESCEGFRLKPESLCVKIHGRHVGEISSLSIQDASKWFLDLPDHLTNKQNEIAARILKEINERLGFLNNVGLSYLNLSRDSGSLSGGESQRIRLASQIGSGLTGVLYVLDEPSIGLHQRDNDRLLQTLTNLRDLGNTVIVVEHDEDAIRTADHVIDMGPAAGVHGGTVVAEGTPDAIMQHGESVTGLYLTGKMAIDVPKERRPFDAARTINIVGARENNLRDVTASIPLGTFTCVTGVSGSGKSTLILDTLYPVLAKTLNRARATAAEHDRIEGISHLDKVVDIDQSPIGRTPRSNPATYTGAFTPIRDWFAGLPEAKARGYKAGRFSFNVKGGRCEACQGDGVIRIEMHFLPDIFVTCESCDGKRFNRETLEVTYRDRSISDVLDLTVDDAVEFFRSVPAVFNKIETLQKVGLGYIRIGQQATTLSGGEAQRVKLAKELSKRATGRTLYILDEPTTGLHFEDVNRLLQVLHTLVEQGNTVLVIEHNLDVIKTADHIIDLGPEGGSGGGQIIATGTPEEVAATEGSHTGHYLSKMRDLTPKVRKAPRKSRKKKTLAA